MKRVGVDTGGTFTDFVAGERGRLVAFKVPSTPRAPEQAVLAGLERLDADRDTVVGHGSTVATNALLERKGARVVLLTNAGFEDLIEIGRQDRPDVYALAPRREPPLVSPECRVGVRERRGPDGRLLHALTAGEARRAVAAARRARPEAIAVGLLHAYADDASERRLARALAGLGAPVTRSTALCPEFREYERIATAVTNAYLAPRVARYLESMARATPARLEVLLSHGGSATVAEAAREPVRQLLSGPAGGLVAATAVGAACGFRRVLTLDVGGTSTDCAFIDGAPPRRRGREVGGFPVLLPLLDVHTVGAGGGSLARVDAGGLLRVGPESAGADPGPACYGRGGGAAVTDALVVLGRIPGDTLAGGALRLDRAAAERAMQRLASALGLSSAVAAAEGVVAVAESHIEAALRKVSVERGDDPRGAALVAFGGAGGLHACAVAEALGGDVVLAPRHAGLLSAIGAWCVGMRRERSRTVLRPAGDRVALLRVWRGLEREVLDGFPRAARGRVRLERWAELRYRGQSHELALAVGRGAADAGRLAARFHAEHERRYGFQRPGTPVDVVNLEVRGALPDRLAPKSPWPRGAARGARVRVRERGRWTQVTAWERETLPRSFTARGPALVIEAGATLWIPRGWSAGMHRSGTMIVTRGRSR